MDYEREPGSDDHLGSETHLDIDDGKLVRREGPPPPHAPPLSPLAPVLPDAYLRWIWLTTPGAVGAPLSSAVLSIIWGRPVSEVRELLRDLARSTRRYQHVARGSGG